MRPIKVYVKNAKGSDLKLLNVINRVKALCYSYGVTLEQVDSPEQKVPYRLDFDATGLTPKDIKVYSSVCSQIGSFMHYGLNLWELTSRENRPEDGLSEIQKTRRRLQAGKTSVDHFQAVLQFYDKVWYLREILGKAKYEPDEKINWELNKKELASLKRLIPKIQYKVIVSGQVEWNEQTAVSSVDAFLTASIKYPYTVEYKKHFTLANVDSSFEKIYRYVRNKIQPAGADEFNNLDSRFDKFFADDRKG